MTVIETAVAAVRIYAEMHPRPPHATPARSLDTLLDPYKAHIEQLREAIDRQPYSMDKAVCETLLATPAQSLARIRNQVREECIDILCTHDGPENVVDVIRARKEPEQ